MIEPYFSLEAAEQQSEEEEINTATISQSPVVNIKGAENDAMRVYSATVIFGREVLALSKTIPFPPTPIHLTEREVQVPSAIYNFILWLLFSDKSCGAECINL